MTHRIGLLPGRAPGLVLALLLAGCGAPVPPPARTPEQRSADSEVSLTALRAGNFAAAEKEASAALALDPLNPQAAAVHALATYIQTGTKLWDELRAVIESADGLKAFDHERGRAAWQTTLDHLDVVDRDLAIAGADPAFSLELCLACLKYDWNRNGRIDDRDDKMLELELDGKGGSLDDGDPRRRPTYHFDVGDVSWARAMIAFQRAAIQIVLAYRWSELDKLFLRGDDAREVVIHLVDGGRVKRARELVLAALDFADQTRAAYLAETDDDREWVPNPRQKSYAMPLEVTDQLYATWAEVTGDVRKLLSSEEGLSIPDVGQVLLGGYLTKMLPAAYVDVGRMLREPRDIVLDLSEAHESPALFEHELRGLLGNGYRTAMRPSPLVARLRRVMTEVAGGEDTFDRKLRYMFWFN